MSIPCRSKSSHNVLNNKENIITKHAAAFVKDEAFSFVLHHAIGVRTEDCACVHSRCNKEELYDMVKDPKQFTNQVVNPEYDAARKQLRNQLAVRLKEEGVRVDEQAGKYIQE